MEIKIIVWILATILGGLLYHLGGTSAGTKWRDLGLPTVAVVYLLTLGINYKPWGFWWLVGAYLLTFGLFFGALTTYWKKKGTDAHWYNWMFTGLGYSLAFIPVAWVSGNWGGFVLRTIIVTLLTTLWSEKMDNVVWEECGRGAIAIGTLPFLLI